MSGSFQIIKVHELDEKLTNLDRQEKTDIYPNGGILSNCVWFADDSNLIVFDKDRGHLLAKWTFTNVLTGKHQVKFVNELSSNYDLPKLLIICLENFIQGGLICLFDLIKSKPIRLIKTEERITAVEVISSYRNEVPTIEFLNCFDGIFGVGFKGGNVWLLDLRRDAYNNNYMHFKDTSTDKLYAKVHVSSLSTVENLSSWRKTASTDGGHVAFHLNYTDNRQRVPHFILKSPTGADKLHANKSETVVSVLYFNTQLCSILVGYNFGAFQLWNLNGLILSYTSAIHKELVPVTHFTMQEPADDPREFCYIWAVYSDPESTFIPEAHMYTLVYNKKERTEKNYTFFQDLESCTIGFKMNLSQLIFKESTMSQCKCINVKMLERKTNSNTSGNSFDSTLSCFAWSYKMNGKSNTLLSIFDLNQWYKEEMPESCIHCEKFLYTFSLDGLVETEVIDVCAHERSCVQYLGVQHLEEQYYPSAISFDFTVQLKDKVIIALRQSVQWTILNQIRHKDMVCFLTPNEVYEKCMKAGIVPLFIDNVANYRDNNRLQMEFILSVALEHSFAGWLNKCASSWCNGSFTSIGCTMELLLNWAWNRTSRLKSNADKICTTLFDYSGINFDENNSRYFSALVAQLIGLCNLYKFILKETKYYLSDIDIIRSQYEELISLTEYYKVIRWMIYIGLLPECSDYIKFINLIISYYSERRLSTRNFNCENLSSIFFIDNFLEKNCGHKSLRKQWIKDGGTGAYPPRSLQALLRIYLVPDISITHKHGFLLYFLMDLEEILRTNSTVDFQSLCTFSTKFKLSLNDRKIIRAFWELDHGNSENAVYMLLDTSIKCEELAQWQHDLLIECLNYYALHKLMLLYIEFKKIPFCDWGKTLMVIRLFAVNGKLLEALKFIREDRSGFNDVPMYNTLFKECQELGTIKTMLQMELTEKEETILFDYLSKINFPDCNELKTVYFLQRSRYINIAERDSDVAKKPESRGLGGFGSLTVEDRIQRMVKHIVPKVNHNKVAVFEPESHDPNIRANLTKVDVFKNRCISVKSKLQSPDDELQTPSAKRCKFNDSDDETTDNKYFTSILKQVTPLVKRKITPPIKGGLIHVYTPHSILKLRKRDGNDKDNDDNEKQMDEDLSDGILSTKEKENPAKPTPQVKSATVRFEVNSTESSVLDEVQSLDNSNNSVSSEKHYSPNASSRPFRTKGTPYLNKDIKDNDSSDSVVSVASSRKSPAPRQSYKDLSILSDLAVNEEKLKKAKPKTILFQNDEELQDDSDACSKLAISIESEMEFSPFDREESDDPLNSAFLLNEKDRDHSFSDTSVSSRKEEDHENSFIGTNNVCFTPSPRRSYVTKRKRSCTPYKKVLNDTVEANLSKSSTDAPNENTSEINEKEVADDDGHQQLSDAVPKDVKEGAETVQSPKALPSPRRSLRLTSLHSSPSGSVRSASKRVSMRKSISHKILMEKVQFAANSSCSEDSTYDVLNMGNISFSVTVEDSEMENADNNIIERIIDTEPEPARSDSGVDEKNVDNESKSQEINEDDNLDVVDSSSEIMNSLHDDEQQKIEEVSDTDVSIDIVDNQSDESVNIFKADVLIDDEDLPSNETIELITTETYQTKSDDEESVVDIEQSIVESDKRSSRKYDTRSSKSIEVDDTNDEPHADDDRAEEIIVDQVSNIATDDKLQKASNIHEQDTLPINKVKETEADVLLKVDDTRKLNDNNVSPKRNVEPKAANEMLETVAPVTRTVMSRRMEKDLILCSPNIDKNIRRNSKPFRSSSSATMDPITTINIPKTDATLTKSHRNKRCASVDSSQVATKSEKSRASRRARSESVDAPQTSYNLRKRLNSTSSVTSVETDIASVSSVSTPKRAASVNIPVGTKDKTTRKRSRNTKENDHDVTMDLDATVNLLETSRMTRSQKKLMESHLADVTEKKNKSKSTSDLTLDTSVARSAKRGRKPELAVIVEEDNVRSTRSRNKK